MYMILEKLSAQAFCWLDLCWGPGTISNTAHIIHNLFMIKIRYQFLAVGMKYVYKKYMPIWCLILITRQSISNIRMHAWCTTYGIKIKSHKYLHAAKIFCSAYKKALWKKKKTWADHYPALLFIFLHNSLLSLTNNHNTYWLFLL